jgi:hypothetical protein
MFTPQILNCILTLIYGEARHPSLFGEIAALFLEELEASS